MADFAVALNKLLSNEGSYSNNASDRGKETYYGISRNNFPAWLGWKTIDQMRSEPGFPKTLNNIPELKLSVAEFYKGQFWNGIYGDSIENNDVANELFDTAVNMGSATAIKMLQKALNLLNRNQKNYSDIVEDGLMGRKTLQLTNEFVDFPVILRTLNALQAMKYIKICEADPTQEEFFRGWLLRAS